MCTEQNGKERERERERERENMKETEKRRPKLVKINVAKEGKPNFIYKHEVNGKMGGEKKARKYKRKR